jgi:hypothetical protein
MQDLDPQEDVGEGEANLVQRGDIRELPEESQQRHHGPRCERKLDVPVVGRAAPVGDRIGDRHYDQSHQRARG